MDYDFKQTFLSKCLLSGLLAGLVSVILNFAYNYIYREVSSYSLSEVVNVTSLIFSSLIVEVAAGVCYYMLSKLSGGRVIYIILFLLLTGLGIYGAMETVRSSNIAAQHEFRILFAGIIAINGLIASFLVPYLINHEKIYS